MGFQARLSGIQAQQAALHRLFKIAIVGAIMAWVSLTAGAQTSGEERFWLQPLAADTGATITIEIPSKTAEPKPPTFRLECSLRSGSSAKETKVDLELRDHAGVLLRTGQTVVDLQAGSVSCAFELALAELPVGDYQGRVLVTPPSGREAVSRLFHLRLTNLATFSSQLDADTGRLDKLDALLTEIQPRVGDLPALRVRLTLAREVIQLARADATTNAVTALDQKLAFLRETIDSIGTSLIWGAFQRETLGKPSAAWSDGLSIREGAFFQGDRAVGLIGATVTGEDPASLERLHRYGLNFAVLRVSADQLLDAAGEPANVATRLGPFFDAAARLQIRVAVQIDANKPGAWALERWPDLAGTQQEMSHPGIQAGLEKTLRALLPYVSKQAAFVGLSLADNPRFRFDGDEIRKQFIEEVRAKYPERPDLNRIWHAHLAKLDEITIWGDHKPFSYQNRAPYQFDWQSFHHTRMLQYVEGVMKTARETAPNAALTLTFPDSVFDCGETRTGLPREPVSALMDLTACTSSLLPKDPIYAMSYPRSMAYYALLKSMQPQKPILNLAASMSVDPDAAPQEGRTLVRTAIIEQALAGVNAMAIPADSPVWIDPWAADALLSSSYDLERLAPVVHAFQNAPAEIGIIFSQSSKILDDGKDYLSTACSAYEGCSFSGYHVRFVTEAQVIAGQLGQIQLLVMPETPALPEPVFKEMENFVNNGGVVVRVGTPIPYDERGRSRQGIIRSTDRTYLVRGKNESTEYLHAIDTVISEQRLPAIARAVNANGYPLEGLKTRTVDWESGRYVYLVNLRRNTMNCRLTGSVQSGVDLLSGKRVEFPMDIPSMTPMLVRLDPTSSAPTVPTTPVPPGKEKKHKK